MRRSLVTASFSQQSVITATNIASWIAVLLVRNSGFYFAIEKIANISSMCVDFSSESDSDDEFEFETVFYLARMKQKSEKSAYMKRRRHGEVIENLL